MESLRERETALLSAVSEFEALPSLNGCNPSLSARGASTDRLSVPATTMSTEIAAVRPARPADPYAQDTARFARGFVHSDFPCKRVAYAPLKRAFDLSIALTVLLLASPIMLIAAILVRLTSRGPIIFKQVRVGQGGKYFWCYKFRSMCVDAEAKKSMLMHLNEASGPVFKIKKDPRLTPIGGFLRKFSVDELPQLFNVLAGDMSIVGPRPPVPAEVSQYTPHQRGRLAVKPGLTCLWQVNGRSNVSFERWVELDLLYIETMSPWQDLKILLMTVPAVMKGSGAH